VLHAPYERGSVRKSLALVLSAGLLVTLAACSSPSTPDCTGAATSGPASDGIDVTGDFGTAPTVTFGSPVDASSVQRTVITQGDGAEAGQGGSMLVDYSLYDAETGDLLGTTGYDGSAQQLWTLTEKGLPTPALQSALVCASAGSRVAITLPADADAQSPAYVVVADVEQTYPRAASGGDAPAVAGFPSVVHDDTGRPGVTIVAGTDTSEFRSTALKVNGSGQVIEDGDTVVVQLMSVTMDGKDTATSTWENGKVIQVGAVATDDPAATGSALLGNALVGAHVGDELIAVVPGAGSTPATTVIIDILGTSPPAAQQQ
jgi:hypothetical protein